MIGGGYQPGNSNVIQFLTIATKGNTIDFGDLSDGKYNRGSTSNSIRGVFAGGGPSHVNLMQFIEIPTTGNASDFGDLTNQYAFYGGCSTGHGGL